MSVTARARDSAIGLAVAAALIFAATGAEAKPPVELRALGPSDFQPVAIPTVSPTATPEPRWHDFPVPVASVAIREPAPTQRPRSEPKSTPAPRTSTGRSITGKASWYCKAGRSVCHYKYPDGPGPDLYAAACGKLRAAIGPSWRGDRVTVSTGSKQVTVKLVDWCGSSDKTIDLYWDAMRVLGGTGVLRVTVKW